MQPTKEDIEKAIETSGYLFEQKIAQIIDKQSVCGWVSTNENYTDDETGKSREIDALAGYTQTFASHRPFNLMDKLYYQLQVLFLFECKNNHHPIVFFSRNNSFTNNFPILTGIPEKVRGGGGEIPFFWTFESKGLKFSEKGQWIASQFAQLKERKNNNGISWELSHENYYESISGLIKAINYYSNEHAKTISNENIKNENIRLCLIFPILVLGGELYECRVNKDGHDLVKVEATILKRQYFSNNIQGEFNIYVTNENHLPNLLSFLDAQEKSIEKIIQDYIIELRVK